MVRKKMKLADEPHIGIRFGGEGDPDCFAGPFFWVELAKSS